MKIAKGNQLLSMIKENQGVKDPFGKYRQGRR
jgi:hypothetical protein